MNVITSSTEDGEWFYANNTVWLAPLRKARDAIEAVKKESPFWAAFALQEKFQTYAKTHFKQSRVEVELEKLERFGHQAPDPGGQFEEHARG